MSEERGLEAQIESLALAVGFDVAGFADPAPSPETRFLRDWISRGYAGCMDYLVSRCEERMDPRRVMSDVRSVVSVGLVYDPGAGDKGPNVAFGRIARYAGGDDYHELMRDRLLALAAGIEVIAGKPVRARAYVDTGPVLEREFAARSGLGWIGKNTCLIHPRLGSYLFLGVLLTDLELASGVPEPDHCGSCRACLDACPTDAFAEPFVLDATRCIAYTTIEDPGPIPEPLRDGHADRLFGCDLCQEVCPWNARPGRTVPSDPLGLRARLAPREHWIHPTLEWVLALEEKDWLDATRRSALRRSRRRGLLRNALVVAGNSGDDALRPAIERHAAGDDPLLAEHARWALARLAALAGRTAWEIAPE